MKTQQLLQVVWVALFLTGNGSLLKAQVPPPEEGENSLDRVRRKPTQVFGHFNPESAWGSIFGFSSDGKYVVSRGHVGKWDEDFPVVFVHDLESGHRKLTYATSDAIDRSHAKTNGAMLIMGERTRALPDQYLVARGIEHSSTLWKRKLTQPFEFCFSPDGSKVIVIEPNLKIANLIDSNTGEDLASLSGLSNSKNDEPLKVALGKRFLAVRSGPTAFEIWNLSDRVKSRTLKLAGLNLYIGQFEFIADDLLLIHSEQSNLDVYSNHYQLWDPATGSKIHDFDTQGISTGPMIGFDLSPDRSLMISKHPNRLVVWNLGSRSRMGELSIPENRIKLRSADENAMTVHRDGRQIPQKAFGTTIGLNSLRITPDNRYVYSAYNGSALKWDLSSGKQLIDPDDRHVDGITDAAVSADDKYIMSSGHRGEIFLWDAKTGQKIKSMKESYDVVGLQSLREGSQFAIAGNTTNDRLQQTGFLEIRNAVDGRLVRKTTQPGLNIRFTISDDRGLMALLQLKPDRNSYLTDPPQKPQFHVDIFDAKNASLRSKVELPMSSYSDAVEISNDGSQVALLSEQSMDLISAGSAKPSRHLNYPQIHSRLLNSAETNTWRQQAHFNWDSGFLYMVSSVSSSSKPYQTLIGCWDTKNSSPVWSNLRDSSPFLFSSRLSPDGRVLAIANLDGGIQSLDLLDALTGRKLLKFAMDGDERLVVRQFSKDGKRIYLSYSGILASWDISDAYKSL